MVNSVNPVIFFCLALSALFALSRSKVQIVQIVQCIFFERCVQKLSVSCSCIFLVILNHFRPCCLPVAYPCRLHLSSMPASSSIFVASLQQPLIIHFCPIFGTTIFLSVCPPSAAFLPPLYIYPTDVLQARAYRSVLCQRSGLTVKSLQFAAKNRKKALLFAYMEKKLYLCTIF